MAENGSTVAEDTQTAPQQNTPSEEMIAEATNGTTTGNGESNVKQDESQPEAATSDQKNGGKAEEEQIENLSAMIRQLSAGTDAVKIKSKSKRLSRVYRLTPDLQYVAWFPSRKSEIRRRISIESIREVRKGRGTQFLQSAATDIPETLCMTIIHGTKYAQLNLAMKTQQDRDAWATALTSLVKISHSEEMKSEARDRWLKQMFEQADVNHDGTLSMKEIQKLLKRLNINFSNREIKKRFKEADTDKSGGLDLKEFSVLFKELATRPEIVSLFTKYASSRDFMTVEDLRNFMIGEQHAAPSVQMCEGFIETYEPIEEVKSRKQMSLDGFSLFLLGSEGNVFLNSCSQITQDMDQPLSHYFINSSHNTYLMEDQLRGPSSIEAYIRAMRKGCRCVELDCWDGDNGEPVIYHGHTLTSKILFKDVIEAIKEHAFATSEYPMILSIENHCSVKQQDVMAKYMTDILGDLLYKDTRDESRSTLPSPNDFKRKILVKGKKLPSEQEDDGDVSEDDEAADLPKEGEQTDGAEKKKTGSIKRSEKKKIKLSKTLSQCINYVQSVHFKSFEKSFESGKCWQMSSFGESKANSYSKDKCMHFVQYNKRQLSRTYPAGTRVDSSNYNPMPMWCAGCQIVALNFQTDCDEMDVNRGMFLQNGGCGYVLKPYVLRDGYGIFDAKAKEEIPGVIPKHYTIRIISGQSLPKPGNVEGEIIDPYVKLEVHGIPADNYICRTRTIQDNGFNPVWNQTFDFRCLFPNLAVLRFKVMDEDKLSADDFIGQFSLPVSCLAPGYRHVHLLLPSGEKLEQATLFIHVTVEQEDNVIYKKFCGIDNGLDKIRHLRKYPSLAPLNILVIDAPMLGRSGDIRLACDLKEDYDFTLLQFKIACGYNAVAGIQECLITMLLYSKVQCEIEISKKGGVLIIKPNCQDVSTVMRNVITAFNELNDAIAGTLKRTDECVANLTQAMETCKSEFKVVEGSMKNLDDKKSLQVALDFTRNMRTFDMFVRGLTQQKEDASRVLKKMEEMLQVEEATM